ncbi:MAG TPA: hypothetical protein VK859_00405, partial [bacterium]|nr:hypothetical protein [bacterium]
MKFRHYVLLVPALIALSSALFTACGSKSSPSSPQNISPTATPNPYTGPTYSLSGAVTYTGGGTVSSAKPIYLF